MIAWLCAAVVVTSVLSFWAGMRVERKRKELQDGMGAQLEAIDREREVRGEPDDCGSDGTAHTAD